MQIKLCCVFWISEMSKISERVECSEWDVHLHLYIMSCSIASNLKNVEGLNIKSCDLFDLFHHSIEVSYYYFFNLCRGIQEICFYGTLGWISTCYYNNKRLLDIGKYGHEWRNAFWHWTNTYFVHSNKLKRHYSSKTCECITRISTALYRRIGTSSCWRNRCA